MADASIITPAGDPDRERGDVDLGHPRLLASSDRSRVVELRAVKMAQQR